MCVLRQQLLCHCQAPQEQASVLDTVNCRDINDLPPLVRMTLVSYKEFKIGLKKWSYKPRKGSQTVENDVSWHSRPCKKRTKMTVITNHEKRTRLLLAYFVFKSVVTQHCSLEPRGFLKGCIFLCVSFSGTTADLVNTDILKIGRRLVMRIRSSTSSWWSPHLDFIPDSAGNLTDPIDQPVCSLFCHWYRKCNRNHQGASGIIILWWHMWPIPLNVQPHVLSEWTQQKNVPISPLQLPP